MIRKSLMVIIALLIVLVALVALSGMLGGDLVDVTSCSMSVGSSDTPFGGALASLASENGQDVKMSDYQVGTAVFKFSLMPRESLTRVTGISLENVEVSFKNGGNENWGSYDFESKNTYIKDTDYKFQISKALKETGENFDEYYSINHIKGDITINTTDETNKVIGHIDEDITPTK